MATSDLALLFPGQGSQNAGMLAEHAEHYPQVQDSFAEASAVLGFDLWELAQSGDKDEIDKTVNAQPLLLTASKALYEIFIDLNPGTKPVACAGHSLGEYSALLCAGVISFADAVALVRLRGELMQAAVPAGSGAMAAILGVAEDQLQAICAECSDERQMVSCANYNAPGQIVISGSSKAVDAAMNLARDKGAKRAVKLAVSVPSHTILMRPAAEKLATRLDGLQFRKPRFPIVQNVHAEPVTDPALLKANLLEQLYRPVLWSDCMQSLWQAGARTFVECGPASVLSALGRRCQRQASFVSLDSLAQLRDFGNE